MDKSYYNEDMNIHINKLCIILLLLLSFVPVGFCQEVVEWKKVAENNYINLDTIVGTDDIYGFMFMLKSYNKGQYEPVNGKSISYTLSQHTIDCGKQKYKIGVIDSYDEFGNFVNGDYNKYAQFQSIVSGTAVSAVAQKLCRPVN